MYTTQDMFENILAHNHHSLDMKDPMTKGLQNAKTMEIHTPLYAKVHSTLHASTIPCYSITCIINYKEGIQPYSRHTQLHKLNKKMIIANTSFSQFHSNQHIHNSFSENHPGKSPSEWTMNPNLISKIQELSFNHQSSKIHICEITLHEFQT